MTIGSIKWFAAWQRPTPSHKSGSGNFEGVNLGDVTPCAVSTRLGSIWLPLIFIDGTRTCWVAPPKLRKWGKMARWMVCLGAPRFFCRSIHRLSERWEKCIASNGRNFEQDICYHSLRINAYFWIKKPNSEVLHLVEANNLSISNSRREKA